jgi:hypothetical protein
MWPTRGSINIAILASCRLNSVVKCTTFCTPSFYRLYILVSLHPTTYWVNDTGTIKSSKSRHNLFRWINSQSSRQKSRFVVVFHRRVPLSHSTFYAIAIASPYLELAREHSILWAVDLWSDFTTCSLNSFYNCLAMPSFLLSYDESTLRRRIRVGYFLFNTRRVRTSKRLKNKPWNLELEQE